QKGYYAYYKITGSPTTTTVTRFLDKDQLTATGCWTKSAGPSSSCTLGGNTYTRRSTLDSRYQIKTRATTYTTFDAAWCRVWCHAGPGPGYSAGSYYTSPEVTATIDPASNDSPITKTSYQGQLITVSGTKYLHYDPPVTFKMVNNMFGTTDSTYD